MVTVPLVAMYSIELLPSMQPGVSSNCAPSDAFFDFADDDLWVLGRKGRYLIAVNEAFMHL